MSAFWASEWPREAEELYRHQLKVRYELAGRMDEEEGSIWSHIFKREAGTLGGGLGVGYLHCRCALSPHIPTFPTRAVSHTHD